MGFMTQITPTGTGDTKANGTSDQTVVSSNLAGGAYI